MDDALAGALLAAQRNEITEHLLYTRLAGVTADAHNREVLQRIARDEMRHYEFFKQKTGRDIGPSRLKAGFFYWISRLFGLTFGVKLMEREEGRAQQMYNTIAESVPGAKAIADEEVAHENALIDMLDEERLKYAGAVVLGLNDALVELTGALAGFTLAFAHTRIIAVAGLITGISAAFSMAGSNYLATKSEGGELKPGKAALYTGAAYMLTVFLLVLPYLLFDSRPLCLGMTLSMALGVIALFNFYIAVAKDLSFWRRFLEMAFISLGIAAISFGIAALIREVLPVEM